MKKIIVLACLLLVNTAAAEAPWQLLTVSFEGTVSAVKFLTKEQCEYAKNRALDLPATKEEKEAEEAWFKANCTATEGYDKDGNYYYESHCAGMWRNTNIKHAECFQL